MRRVLTTPPAIEPITLAEAKAHARITTSDDDALVSALIVAAREYVEAYIHGALINQTWTFYWNAGDISLFNQRYFSLPLTPIRSITSISIYDTDGIGTPFTDYTLSGDRIVLNDNYDWPYLYRSQDSTAVVVVLGFGPLATDVPASLRLAIKILVTQWYEKREAVFDSSEISQGSIPFGVSTLLARYRNVFV